MTDPILLTHAQKYPLMEPRDAVKLLYQRNFGGGHLIPDEAACLDFLQQEYTNTPPDRRAAAGRDRERHGSCYVVGTGCLGLSTGAVGTGFYPFCHVGTGKSGILSTVSFHAGRNDPEGADAIFRSGTGRVSCGICRPGLSHRIPQRSLPQCLPSGLPSTPYRPYSRQNQEAGVRYTCFFPYSISRSFWPWSLFPAKWIFPSESTPMEK